MTEIFVDADACPVKPEIERVAERHGLVVHIVSNGGIRPSQNPLVKTVIVPEGADAADDWIAEHITEADICITADIPLAARCIAANARVVRPSGKPLDENSISMALAVRNLHTHLRDIGEATRGPAPFTKQDRARFLDILETTVRAARAVPTG